MRKIPKRVSVIVTLSDKTVYISVSGKIQRPVAVGILHDAISMLTQAPFVINPRDFSTQVAVTFLKDYEEPDNPDTEATI